MEAEEVIAISRDKKNHKEDTMQGTKEKLGYDCAKDQIYDGRKYEGNVKEYNIDSISDGQEPRG